MHSITPPLFKKILNKRNQTTTNHGFLCMKYKNFYFEKNLEFRFGPLNSTSWWGGVWNFVRDTMYFKQKWLAIQLFFIKIWCHDLTWKMATFLHVFQGFHKNSSIFYTGLIKFPTKFMHSAWWAEFFLTWKNCTVLHVFHVFLVDSLIFQGEFKNILWPFDVLLLEKTRQWITRFLRETSFFWICLHSTVHCSFLPKTTIKQTFARHKHSPREEVYISRD